MQGNNIKMIIIAKIEDIEIAACIERVESDSLIKYHQLEKVEIWNYSQRQDI